MHGIEGKTRSPEGVSANIFRCFQGHISVKPSLLIAIDILTVWKNSAQY